MTLSAGSRLGPYEITAAIGAGGMGEVYRARDTRLGREVAIKVLPASFSADADRLRRFEQEAKAAGVLNHPNITAVYDIGSHEGAPYVVQELLEGETLRGELAGGRFSQRKAIDCAQQLAHGLAAAHGKGIVHRDLKPENVFVTKDGRVKILDFGLAKLTHAEEGSQATSLPTATAGTEPGVVLGTLGYMSPEQVKGKPADVRSDIFSFGAILYEMLSGQRAFHRDSAAETMSAILREDPPDLSVTNQNISPGLERIVRHCLEKNPEQRFHSAHDLAFDLEALSGASGVGAAAPAVARLGWKTRLAPGVLAIALLALPLGGYLLGRRAAGAAAAPQPSYRQLTYHHGTITSARFAPDGQTIAFAAAWEGSPLQLFSTRLEFPESRPMGFGSAALLSVSSQGELAIIVGGRPEPHLMVRGTLSQAALAGGAPREILEDVRQADWAPDGKSLAVVHTVGNRERLEFPVGRALYETSGWISHPRVWPAGDRIAFFDHPVWPDDRGSVAFVDLSGKKRTLSTGWESEEGLAWSPDGREILFSAGPGYSSFDVRAVTLTGRNRVALPSSGGLTIFDISREGRWLAAREDVKWRLMAMAPGANTERDLSWLDGSLVVALSADGRSLLFTEYSGAFGNNYAVSLRKTDGSPVVRLGEGWAGDLSPDGRWALAVVATSPDRLMLYPAGPGEPRRLESSDIREYSSARWFPDGKRILVCGTEVKHASRCYVQDVSGGKPRPVTSEGSRNGIVSPDGTLILVQGSRDEYQLYPSAGGEPRPVSSLAPDDVVARWTADGRGLLAYHWSVPARLERVDLATGRRDFVHRLAPPDLAGVVRIQNVTVASDENVYAYSAIQRRSDLFLVEGAR